MRAVGVLAFLLTWATAQAQHDVVEGPVQPVSEDSTYRMRFEPAAEGSYRVMTYNLRYFTFGDGPNAWPERMVQVADQVQRIAPDFIGTQEGLYRQLMDLQGLASSDSLHRVACRQAGLPYQEGIGHVDYGWVGVGRDSGDHRGEHCAIFYRYDRFDCVYSETFWLTRHPEEPSKDWDAALPRIATLAVMRELRTGRLLCVVNTHFDHMGVKARDKSAKVILDKLRGYVKTGYPIVLMGDLNLTPNEKPIQRLAKALQESYAHAPLHYTGAPAAEPVHGTFNAFQYGKPHDRRIDYVFASEDWSVLNHGIIAESTHGHYPSDHFPVVVDLALGN